MSIVISNRASHCIRLDAFLTTCRQQPGAFLFITSHHYPLDVNSVLFASTPSNGAKAGVKSPESKNKGKGKGAVASPDVSMEEDEEDEEEETADEEMEDVRETPLARLSCRTQHLPIHKLRVIRKRRKTTTTTMKKNSTRLTQGQS